MSEYFIEIYGEEIPSQAQIYGEKFISNFFSEILNQKNISYDSITTFSNVKKTNKYSNNVGILEENLTFFLIKFKKYY